MSEQQNLVLSDEEAQKILNRQPVKFLKRKDGPVVGRFLSTRAASFWQHGDWEQQVQSHACLRGKDGPIDLCPSCKKGMKRVIKHLVFLWNLVQGGIVVKDLSPTAWKELQKNVVEEYGWTNEDGNGLLQGAFKIAAGEKGAFTVLPVKMPPNPVLPSSDLIDDEGLLANLDTLNYALGRRSPEEVEELIKNWSKDKKSAPTDSNSEPSF